MISSVPLRPIVASLRRRAAFYATTVSAVVLILAASEAHAQSFVVPNGATDTTAKTMTGTQTGQVDAGGTLRTTAGVVTIAIETTTPPTGVVVTNDGTIEQTGTARVIDVTGGTTQRGFTLLNGATGIVRSTQNDTVRVNVAVADSSIMIDNSGLIRSGGAGFAALGQAIDWRGISASSNNTLSILNRAGGIIESLTDDAIRPGQETAIDNSGTIRSFGANTSGGANGTSDAIDVGARTGVVVTNRTGGLISGARHGINVDLGNDITVVNEAGATIVGRNGSGVGSDGNGTVTNRGTITGAYAGPGNIFNSDGTASLNGDGDGVDIDGIGTVTNFGTIQGTGAGGVDSGARPNGADGIAMGGGTIDNRAGATISGGGRGILIDDGAFGSGVAALSVTNAGTIQGLAATGLGMIGNFNNSVVNSGSVTGAGAEGAVFVIGNGASTITNSGTISTSGTAQAVFFNGNGANSLVNTGTIATSGAGTAVQFGDGNNGVTTSGSIRASSASGTALRFGNGNNTLAIGGGDVLGDVIGGTGTNALTIALGTGTSFQLSGNFTGFSSTAVQSGRLAVNASLASTTVAVASGAALSGTGTIVGSVTLAAGSTIAPGNSPGTLTIGGDLGFAAGSTYAVEIAASGVSDRIDVGGTATLGGADVSVATLDPEVSYQNGQSYTILSAGAVVGTFAAPTIAGGSAFLTPTLIYRPTTVTLSIVTATTPTSPTTPAPLFVTAATTPNQRGVATGLNGLAQTPGSLALYNAVLFSATPGAARAAFDQLSGEIHASEKTGRLGDARLVRNTAMDRLKAVFAAPGTGATTSGPNEGAVMLGSSGLSAWIAGYGSWGETDGTANTASLDRDSGGFLVGADGLLTETLTVGLMAGYGEASFDTSRRGSADVDTTTIGIYAGTELGGVALKAGATYGFSEIDTSREVAFGAFRDSLTAGYDGETAQVFGEASYRFDVAPSTTLSPFADIAYVSLDTDGFTERGGAAALRSGGDTADATFTTLGLKASTALPLGDMALSANAMLGWRHAFGDLDPTETLAFATGPAFTVAGAPLAEDAAVVELGLGLDVTPAATLGLAYSGQFGDGVTDNGVKARLDVRF